jgi:hypothetical protein
VAVDEDDPERFLGMPHNFLFSCAIRRADSLDELRISSDVVERFWSGTLKYFSSEIARSEPPREAEKSFGIRKKGKKPSHHVFDGMRKKGG